jgi:hypothetical protein
MSTDIWEIPSASQDYGATIKKTDLVSRHLTPPASLLNVPLSDFAAQPQNSVQTIAKAVNS